MRLSSPLRQKNIWQYYPKNIWQWLETGYKIGWSIWYGGLVSLWHNVSRLVSPIQWVNLTKWATSWLGFQLPKTCTTGNSGELHYVHVVHHIKKPLITCCCVRIQVWKWFGLQLMKMWNNSIIRLVLCPGLFHCLYKQFTLSQLFRPVQQHFGSKMDSFGFVLHRMALVTHLVPTQKPFSQQASPKWWLWQKHLKLWETAWDIWRYWNTIVHWHDTTLDKE